jgi:sugar lactone lactonase YvrE
MRTRSILLLTAILCCSAWGQTYTISTFAGGLPANIPGTSVGLCLDQSWVSVATDRAGNVFFVCQDSVLRLDAATGIVTPVAGNGTWSFSGDNGPATSAGLAWPNGLAVDSAGNLYIADSFDSRIRKVSNGVITTVAGNGTRGFSGDGGPATSAQLYSPQGVAVDSAGNLYIADSGDNCIRKVSNGTITTVAGDGTEGFSGDNGPATAARLSHPTGLAVDSAGNLYIADFSNNRIRKISNGVITTVAGNGTLPPGSSGDGGPATSAQLVYPTSVAVDSAGNLYIADAGNNCIRKVSNGVITTVAGNGIPGFSGDNGPAASAQLYLPEGVAVDSAGSLYIADLHNQRIRKVSNGVITTVTGGSSSVGDNGPATSAQLDEPWGVALDSAGALYIADSNNFRVREVSGGVITTVAGTGTNGFSGDNGPASGARLNYPIGVAADSAGNLYIADGANYRIRKISGGLITTVAGNGTYGFGGDNGPATSAELHGPAGVAVDSAGSLFIADSGNGRVRKVSNGVITTVAGNGTPGSGGDNGPATSAELCLPPASLWTPRAASSSPTFPTTASARSRMERSSPWRETGRTASAATTDRLPAPR